jgi:hypothetical protein
MLVLPRLVVLMLAVAAAFGPASSAFGQSVRDGEAWRLVPRLGISEAQVSEATTHTLELPALGMTVTQVKAVLAETGEVVGGAFDQAGRAVDLAHLRQVEIAARAGNPGGKLAKPLATRLATAGEAELVPVVAWLNFDGAALDAYAAAILAGVDSKADTKKVRELEEIISANVRASNERVTALASRQLEFLGVRPSSVSIFAPAVFFDATRAQIADIEKLECVDTLYLQCRGGGFSNSDANATHRTTRVHQQGVRGQGVRFANIGGADPANPYLNIAGLYNPGGAPTAHGTQVTGCVGSRHPDRLGSAPDAEIWAAQLLSLGDVDITAAADWLAAQSTDVSNMSYYVADDTVIHYQDRYFDYLSRYMQDSYVTAAGNFGNASTNVPTPSKGWNVLTVGNHTDGGDGNWTGDVMNTSSSFTNPTTGVEKPNLAANGTNISTLDLASNGSLTASSVTGTSYASPHCAGNLCNAMVVNPFIQACPEAAMALMMCTAWHNIEGAATISTKDGAGGIDGLAAFRCAKDNRATFVYLTPTSFNNNGYYTHTIYLTAGDRARVCIAWSASVSATYSTSSLDADLDLAVFSGTNVTTGTPAALSGSFVNNFELVEFTPSVSGSYTIRINDYAFSGAGELCGIAWSQKYRDTSSFQVRERVMESATDAGPTIGNGYYFMDLDAPNSPTAQYAFVPTGTIPYAGPGFAASAQTWLPLTYDAVTALWEQDLASFTFNIWSGSTGLLTASGASTSNRMLIPPDPGIVGLSFWEFGVTLEPGYPDGVKEISDPYKVTLWPVGINKTTSDDGYFIQTLPSGFSFYGTPYTQCYVNMNGSITFGGPSSDFTETQAEFLSGLPRIAFLWDDLDASAIGSEGIPTVRVRQVLTGPSDQQFVVIEFVSVPQYNTVDANTVRVTLRGYTSAIEIEYADCDVSDCIVGLSPGSSISNASFVDLSTLGEQKSGPNKAFYEVFSVFPVFNVFDLSNDSLHWNRLKFTPVDIFVVNDYKLTMELQ